MQRVPRRMKWWLEARYGMFIHWGLYSLLKRGEWVMYCERIPKSEYQELAKKFNPRKYDPREWVALAKRAGQKYMVITTRHHDGFCLWDTDTTDYCAPKQAAGRDLIGEFVEACREAGMRIGFYYSLLDWRWPAYWEGPEKNPAAWEEFVDYVHAQVIELMSKYGKIDILWYDGAWPWTAEHWQSEKLNRKVRRLQPGIIINNRSGLPEDFGTPEQRIQAEDRPWESCMTITEAWWGYHAGVKKIKSPLEIIHTLVTCVSQGGNFLLNVGPKADGTIPREQARPLEEAGKWLEANGESVYGCGPAPFAEPHLGRVTLKEKTAYVHVFFWPGTEAVVAGVKNKVKGAWLLATGEELAFRQEGDRIIIEGLPARPPDPIDTVIKLELSGKPAGISPQESGFWLK